MLIFHKTLQSFCISKSFDASSLFSYNGTIEKYSCKMTAYYRDCYQIKNRQFEFDPNIKPIKNYTLRVIKMLEQMVQDFLIENDADSS